MRGRFFFVKRKAIRHDVSMHGLDIPGGDFAAYIFDCDGTLADSMGIHYEAWKLALGPRGAELPEALYHSWGGRPTREIVGELNGMHGLSMDPDDLSREKEGHYHTLLPKVRAIVPVVGFARSMHGKKPLAVASGGGRTAVTATLNGLGILGLFDAVVTSEDYVRGKPAPDPYLAAARRLGVDPSGCLVFEDTEIGRRSALAAGMSCVLVPTSWNRAGVEAAGR
jgi:beta-phosphoglucomutase-like phosphatase (HAD superfamily)